MKYKIPRILVNYFDRCDKECSLGMLLDFDHLWEEDEDDVSKWLFNNDQAENNRRYALACQAYVKGYEAEDEPKYYVALPSLSNINFYLHISVEGYFNFFTKKDCPRDKCQFTEQEIKAIDERYWPFAVPVEEENQ